MKKLTKEEFEDKIKSAHPRENLKVISYGGDKKNSEVVCLNCNTHYIKQSGCFTDRRKVSICKNCFPTQPNTLKTDYKPPEGYELLEPYKGMHNKIKVKHLNCGFIWEITPNNLDLGKGCPKCNRKISKGEQKIIKWLNDNNITYETQKKIIIDGHNLTIDFYLPKIDLYIEYNGEQHYKPVNFFGGEEKFKKQQFLDSLKVKELKEKLLVISYEDFNNINKILESSTTISKESTL